MQLTLWAHVDAFARVGRASSLRQHSTCAETRQLIRRVSILDGWLHREHLDARLLRDVIDVVDNDNLIGASWQQQRRASDSTGLPATILHANHAPFSDGHDEKDDRRKSCSVRCAEP